MTGRHHGLFDAQLALTGFQAGEGPEPPGGNGPILHVWVPAGHDRMPTRVELLLESQGVCTSTYKFDNVAHNAEGANVPALTPTTPCSFKMCPPRFHVPAVATTLLTKIPLRPTTGAGVHHTLTEFVTALANPAALRAALAEAQRLPASVVASHKSC